METANQFDLNRAILDCRKTLANSPAVGHGDLDELESHLRDSVTCLQAAGLAPHEAFSIARSRLGTFDVLHEEYGKVNTDQVWFDRVLWMVIGCIVLSVGSGLVGGLVTLITVGMFKVTTQSSILGPVGMALHVVAFAVLLQFLWKSGRSKEALLWRLGQWLKMRPRIAGAIALALMVLSSASSASALALGAKLMPVHTYSSLMLWRSPAVLVVHLLWPAILVWLLARKRSKQGSSLAD